MALVLLSIGSNIDRENNIRLAVSALRELFGPLRLSRVYETPSVGFNGPPFYNLAAAFESELPPKGIAGQLKMIEQRLGRSREESGFSSRNIDIDLLTYGDLCLDDAGLQIPRADILNHAFVLKPLADLAGDTLHPRLKRSYSRLWQQFEGDRSLAESGFVIAE